MSTQLEAFPKTRLDFATEFLEHFQADVESAEKSLLNAQARLAAAIVLRDDAEENLRRERIAAGIATGEEVVVDPITGEVSGPFDDELPVNPLEDADDQAECVPHVYVRWPGESEMVSTEVGERTQFAELVFDYLAQNDPKGDAADYRILSAEHVEIDPKNVIMLQDHGNEFTIERREAQAEGGKTA